MSGDGLSRQGEGWLVPVTGGRVVQVRIDFAFGLLIDGATGTSVSCEVRISGPFRYTSGEAAATIDPERTGDLASLIELHGAGVDEAYASDSGRLELRFEGGRSISVSSDPAFEAWELSVVSRPTGRTVGLVSLPGSGLTVVGDARPSVGPDPDSHEVAVVHTRRGVLLTKDRCRDWRDVQDSFEDYMASLGSYSVRELERYLEMDYPTNPPFAPGRIVEFVQSEERQLWA